jgi:hypothetical protein
MYKNEIIRKIISVYSTIILNEQGPEQKSSRPYFQKFFFRNSKEKLIFN